MNYIKLTVVGHFGNTSELAIDTLNIKYMHSVDEIKIIKLSDEEFTVTQSIDEIIEKIEAHSNAILKIIEKMTGDDDFDINIKLKYDDIIYYIDSFVDNSIHSR